ncbi:MAG: hypothetical protein ABIS28_17330 [Caldimonas sp.]
MRAHDRSRFTFVNPILRFIPNPAEQQAEEGVPVTERAPIAGVAPFLD